MQSFINFIQQIGAAGINLLWLPLAIWTVLTVIVLIFLRAAKSRIFTIYQYHSRVALLWALPVGVAGALLFQFIPGSSAVEYNMARPLFIIQQPDPIAITASAAQYSINWGSPTLWLGILTLCTGVLAIYGLIKLLSNFVYLKRFKQKLSHASSVSSDDMSRPNRQLLLSQQQPVNVVFSEAVDVPCTYGWGQKWIVLPRHLQRSIEKVNMAIRHELIHIQNHDYQINAAVQFVRALFFVHPLVHKLMNDIAEHREICCDQQVVQHSGISQRNYAQLLFDLSDKTVFKPTTAVKMAVKPSTLKKRIQTMKNSTHNIPPFRTSMALMVVFVLMISGLMACSDVSDNGVTNTNLKKIQTQLANTPTDSTAFQVIFGPHTTPLLIIDGKKIPSSNMKEVLSNQLDAGNIKSMTVLKKEEAVKAYGKAGRNGVIIVKLKNEKGASNNQTSASINKKNQNIQFNIHIKNQQGKKTAVQNDTVVQPPFHAVQQPPKMKTSYKEFLSHVNYPQKCKELGIEGTVVVKFIINKQGIPTNIHVIKGIGGGCDQAAVKAIKKDLRFTPGRQQGRKVRVMKSIVIHFNLKDHGTDK